MDTEKKDIYVPKQMRLDGVPEDVYDILIDVQAEHKKKCKCQFSLEQTIYKIIRETKRKL